MSKFVALHWDTRKSLRMAAAEGITHGSGLGQYEILGTIGQGSFGTVQKVKRKADGRVSFTHVSWVTLVTHNCWLQVLVCKSMNYGSMGEKEKQLVVSEVCLMCNGGICRAFRHDTFGSDAGEYFAGAEAPVHCAVLRSHRGQGINDDKHHHGVL